MTNSEATKIEYRSAKVREEVLLDRSRIKSGGTRHTKCERQVGTLCNLANNYTGEHVQKQ